MTDRGFEQLLERCMHEVLRTGDTEAVLRQHPGHAERLRPLLEIAMTASQSYADVPEPPEGLTAGRERLLHTAALQRERARETNIPEPRQERKPMMKLVFATKLISAILALTIGTAAVGGGAAWAASDSLPGDILYPVKLTAEELRLSLATSSESQVALALQFADERVAEMKGLVEQEQPVPESVVARMERHIVQAMNQAAWASEEEMPGLLERIAERTQTQARELEGAQAGVQEQNQEQLENALRICRQASDEASAGLGEPETYRHRFQHRESMPDDMTPPERPTPEPQGPQGPNSEDEEDKPQGDHDPEQGQDRDQEQERGRDQDQGGEGDQESPGEQQQDRDRQQDQDRQQDPDDGHEPIRQRDQDRDQEPAGDPQRGEPDEQPGQNDDEPNHDQGQDQGPNGSQDDGNCQNCDNGEGGGNGHDGDDGQGDKGQKGDD